MAQDAPPTAATPHVGASIALEMDGAAVIGHEAITNRVQIMIAIRPVTPTTRPNQPRVHALVEADNHYDDPDGPLIAIGLGMDRDGLDALITHLICVRDAWTAAA